MTQHCFRCGNPIEEPVEENAAYVRGSDTVETETVEVAEAVVHTQATKDAINALQANHYPDRSIGEIERAVASDTDMVGYLGTPPVDSSNDPPTRENNAKVKAPALADFDRVEITDVADAPTDTVKVERVVKQRDVQKQALVHVDEVKDSDEVIWSA